MKYQQQIELEDILETTFQDMKLSNSESDAIRQIVDDIQADHQALAFMRNKAFGIARKHINSNPTQVIDWLERLDKIIDNATRHPAQPSSSKQPVTTFSPGTSCLQLINQTLAEARIAIDICVFTITDNHITQQLIDLHKRGIPIRIISDDDKSTDDGSDIYQLKRMGIPTRTDHTSNHMHHKFAIIDHKTLLTGSYNWTRGARHNHENILRIHDSSIIKAYSQTFDHLWNEFDI
ncbi:phospholipase D-like domain-containing protein [Poriferisphaera corsica]|uniref:phospholipase D-like domain-containing protein n=1 Tax=Poriferisphaera corsica TaxID=2528020 RepID=UPI00190B7560|nr:phospholipase D-like domain-containing protein [Poriferisphaera corsica]